MVIIIVNWLSLFMLNKCFLILFTLTALSFSQTKEYEIYQIQFLYNDAKFNTVIKNGRSVLNSNYTFTNDELIEIHKYLALSFYNTGQEDSSRSHFFTILTLDANFEPDSTHFTANFRLLRYQLCQEKENHIPTQ